MNLHHAHFLAPGPQVVHHLLGGLAGGTHHHNDPLRVRRTVVVENVVIPAGNPVDALHVALHNAGNGVVGGVVGLLTLEIDVGSLYRGAVQGMLRVHGDPVIGLQSVLVYQSRNGIQVDHLDLLNLVGCPEPVKEVDEGHPGLHRGQMGHGGQVHNLLDAGGGHHGHTGGAAAHHVLVVAEDVVGMLGDRPGRHMEHGGHPVAGHDVHIGNHQQQALGRGEGGGHGAGLRRAVEGAGGAALGLHLHQAHALAEHVLAAGGGPLVHLLAHGRGGRDGKNSRHIREMIGNVGTGLVAVHGFHDNFVRHCISSLYSPARSALRAGRIHITS